MLRDHRERLITCRSWQPQFIQDNFLIIGYHALRGFTTSGKGITVCTINPPANNFKPIFHIWQFTTQFIAAEFAANYLLEMGVSSRQIPSLIPAISSYDPPQEIILANEYRSANRNLLPSKSEDFTFRMLQTSLRSLG